jgi:DnaJ like chaperone protein
LQKDVDLGPVCNQIKGSMSHARRLQLVHYLVGIANADGHIHEQEWNLLESIARRLNVNHKDLESLCAMYQVDKDRYYRILEIEKGASKEEIKKAYRKMVKKYHPDKLGDIGKDAKNTAIEKFRMVQEAYDELNK